MSLDWSPEISMATLRLKQAAEAVYSLTGLDGTKLNWDDVMRLEHAKDRIDKMLSETKRNAA